LGFSSLGGRNPTGKVIPIVGDVTDKVGDDSIFIGAALDEIKEAAEAATVGFVGAGGGSGVDSTGAAGGAGAMVDVEVATSCSGASSN
jgi:hypothetical protein